MAWVNERGEHFSQLIDFVPSLRPLYSEYEINYNTVPWHNKTVELWWLPIVTVAGYLVMCVAGPKVMAKQKPMNLKYTLAAWNFFLSAFSWAGALRTVPHILYMVFTRPHIDTICGPPAEEWGCGSTGLWVQLFIFSKIPELGDTVFLVLRQKPIIFLHWYHHITVLLYCWHSYSTEAAQALYFIAMNYSVHAIMYGYYGLTGLGIRPKWMKPWYITVAQLSQMFVGVAVQVSAMMAYSSGRTCAVNYWNLVAGAVMYGSYFALFLKFAVERFILPQKKQPAQASKPTSPKPKAKGKKTPKAQD